MFKKENEIFYSEDSKRIEERFIKGLCSNKDIFLEFTNAGLPPCTNGKKISFPKEELTEKEIKRLEELQKKYNLHDYSTVWIFKRGIIIHEIGHILFSQDMLRLLQKEEKSPDINLIQEISNIYEDAYIERAMAAEFLGAYKFLNFSNEVHIPTEKEEKELSAIKGELERYMLYMAFKVITGTELKEVYSSFTDKTKECIERTLPLFLQASVETNSKKRFDYSFRIIKIIKEYFEDKEMQSLQPKMVAIPQISTGAKSLRKDAPDKAEIMSAGEQLGQQNPENTDSDDGSDSSDGSGNSENTDSDDTDGSDTSSKDSAKSSSSDSTSTNSVEKSSSPMDLSTENRQGEKNKDSIEKAVKEAEENSQNKKNSSQKISDSLKDIDKTSVKNIFYERPESSVEREYFERMKPYMASVKKYSRDLSKLLENKEEGIETKLLIGSSLDSRNFSDKKRRYWKVSHDKKERAELYMTLVVDCSGSMSGRIDRAAEATAFVAEIANAAKIPVQIIGFEYNNYIKQYHVLGFSDNFETYRGNIMSLKSGCANRDSYTANYVRKQLTALEQVNPRRKDIIVWLSDGLPSAYSSGENGQELTKRAVSLLEKSAQREVLAVALGDERLQRSLSEEFKKVLLCKEVSVLPSILLNVLKKNFLRNL